jgi:hypothetical protein
VGNPFNAGRDSNADPSNDFGDYKGRNAAGAAEEGFDAQLPGDPRPGEAVPGAGRFTYPYLRGPGGALADD